MDGRNRRFGSFCFNRVPTRVRVRSPATDSRAVSRRMKADPAIVLSPAKMKGYDERRKVGFGNGRLVMVVLDSSPEAKTALEWGLSHTIHEEDTLLLLYVTKPSRRCEERKRREMNRRRYQFLCSMKNGCQVRKTEVQVQVAVVEGREKGATILEEVERRGVSLLVVGQRRRSMMKQFLMKRMTGRVTTTADYCIQNANCMTVGVRRKSKRLGGYVISTKHHKDFWLLA